MLVGIMSDSHDNIAKIDAAMSLFSNSGVRMIIHLGDYVAPFSLTRILRSGIRFVGILGNNDGEKLGLREIAVRAGQELYEPPFETEIEGKRVIMIHGYGPKEKTRAIIDSIARGGDYDLILYGHTHEPDIRVEKGTLIINPGEVYGILTGRSTVAILDINRMEARIVEI
ncbi:MAG TPA: metallophosphoesterase [Sulfolobales archaeon]|nr:metallophosphoesterase [Sulfolobales archaeon]